MIVRRAAIELYTRSQQHKDLQYYSPVINPEGETVPSDLALERPPINHDPSFTQRHSIGGWRSPENFQSVQTINTVRRLKNTALSAKYARIRGQALR